MTGRTTALYGVSGSGKTTQIGEYAKYIFKTTGKKTKLFAADLGGYDSLDPFVDLGILEVDTFGEADDPWTWINDAVSGPVADDIGLVAIDSATSVGEALLSNCAKQAAKGVQIGQQKVFKLVIPTAKEPITIGGNNESQYGLVQTYLLDMIWKSTWLARRQSIDVLWTFGEHRAERDEVPIVGPKLAGKALTGQIPKWLRYTFRIVAVPQVDSPAKHILHIQEQADPSGMSFGNSRYPLDATTELPSSIEPASIVRVWELIEQGKEEARENLKSQLGL